MFRFFSGDNDSVIHSNSEEILHEKLDKTDRKWVFFERATIVIFMYESNHWNGEKHPKECNKTWMRGMIIDDNVEISIK
jgi:hypothetical protein